MAMPGSIRAPGQLTDRIRSFVWLRTLPALLQFWGVLADRIDILVPDLNAAHPRNYNPAAPIEGFGGVRPVFREPWIGFGTD